MSSVPGDLPQQLTDEHRQALLAQAITHWVASGARVESHLPNQAVLVTGKNVNHVLHLILTLVTCLAWGIVWAILAATVREKRHVLSIDPYGNVVVASR